MTGRSQQRKSVEVLISQDLETPLAENNQAESLIAGPCESLKVHLENLNEFKTSLRKEIISDLAKTKRKC